MQGRRASLGLECETVASDASLWHQSVGDLEVEECERAVYTQGLELWHMCGSGDGVLQVSESNNLINLSDLLISGVCLLSDRISLYL